MKLNISFGNTTCIQYLYIACMQNYNAMQFQQHDSGNVFTIVSEYKTGKLKHPLPWNQRKGHMRVTCLNYSM